MNAAHPATASDRKVIAIPARIARFATYMGLRVNR